MKSGARERTRGIFRGRRLGAPLAVAACALAVLAAPTNAFGLGVSGSTTPASTQAGAHSDLTIHVAFTGGQVKDITVGLPPGQVGDPQATPKCSVAQLNADACPAGDTVGTVTTDVTATVPPGIPVPLTVTGTIYNLVAQPGEPARFGIVLRPLASPPIILQSAVQLRPTDFGLNTVINSIPNTAQLAVLGLPLATLSTTINSMDITLQGTAGGKSFLRNPTKCGTATTNFSADSYQAPNTQATAQASYNVTNCGALPFSPTFSARLGAQGQTDVGTNPPVSTSIDQDVGEAGLLHAQVLLPSNISADLAVLSQVCPPATFQAGNCPANTIVGTAVATSPLLTLPLDGPVILIDNPGLPKVGLDLKGQLAMKLIGSFVVAGGGTGVDFDGLPDIPISHFALKFRGGKGGLSVTSTDLCASPSVFNESFDAYSGAHTALTTTAAVDGCGPVPPADITATLRKAHSRHPRLSMQVTGGKRPNRVTVKLPKALKLHSGSRGISASDESSVLASGAFTHKKHKLNIAVSSSTLHLHIGKGGLTRTGHIGRRVKLKVKIATAAGVTTQKVFAKVL
jgi:hypothetical protein